MLTLKELMALLTQQSSPWRVRDLLALLKVKVLSLRSITEAVDQAQAVMLVQVRDLPLISKVNSLQDVQSLWASNFPSRNTILKLTQFLNSYGATMPYDLLVYDDWKTAGITGTVGSLSQISCIAIQSDNDVQSFLNSVHDFINDVGYTTGALVVVGGFLFGPIPVLIVLGKVTVGAFAVAATIKLGQIIARAINHYVPADSPKTIVSVPKIQVIQLDPNDPYNPKWTIDHPFIYGSTTDWDPTGMPDYSQWVPINDDNLGPYPQANPPSIDSTSGPCPDGYYRNQTGVCVPGTRGSTGSTSGSSSSDGGTHTNPLHVFGCTNPKAINYNANATDDDGSCIFECPEGYSPDENGNCVPNDR